MPGQSTPGHTPLDILGIDISKDQLPAHMLWAGEEEVKVGLKEFGSEMAGTNEKRLAKARALAEAQAEAAAELSALPPEESASKPKSAFFV